MNSDPSKPESDILEDAAQESEFEPAETEAVEGAAVTESGEAESEPAEGAGEADQPEKPAEAKAEEKPRRRFRMPAFQWDVYTVMLWISLLAIIVACLLLFTELQQYSPFPWWRTSGVVPGG